MIVSVSRRTDIPAFYSEWFINRARQGWCLVPNPFNSNQVSRVDITPDQVDAFVFWSRNPCPLIRYLDELDDMGFRYYFLLTLTGYSGPIEPGGPPLVESIKTFQKLSTLVGPERVIWRYDPIVLSAITSPSFHMRNFRLLAGELKGAVRRCVISFFRPYRKARARMEAASQGSTEPIEFGSSEMHTLLSEIARSGFENKMEIFSCAMDHDLSEFNISPSKCIDADLILKLFGIPVSHSKDPYQRKECGCAVSRDIGVYDTCLFGCNYCYATSNIGRAKANHARHDPLSPCLVG